MLRHLLFSILRWFDSEAGLEQLQQTERPGVDWFRIFPFIALHLMCFAVLWVGWSWAAIVTALVMYLIRMFAITGFYHRYFSHKSFKTNRFWQFLFALLGNSAVQRGPLWWAAHHRHHHRFADQENDVHSPLQHGFWWSHIGWLTSTQSFRTNYRYIGDFAKFSELYWLNRFDILAPIALAVSLFGFGTLLEIYVPQWKTYGFQMLIWGFFISTTLLFHATATINSLDHLLGSRRYATPDTSRNNFWLSLLTLGEGWHNNHHHYAVSARQGFFWWELDITYYGLLLLSWFGIIWDLQPVPDRIKRAQLIQERGG